MYDGSLHLEEIESSLSESEQEQKNHKAGNRPKNVRDFLMDEEDGDEVSGMKVPPNQLRNTNKSQAMRGQ